MADLSKYNKEHAIVLSFDEETKALKTRTNLSNAAGEALTTTDIAEKKALDVNVASIVLSKDDDSITSYVAKEAVQVDFISSSSYVYKGYAAVGSSKANPVWLISRISLLDGNAGTVEYASSSYNQIWNNRAALTYN